MESGAEYLQFITGKTLFSQRHDAYVIASMQKTEYTKWNHDTKY